MRIARLLLPWFAGALAAALAGGRFRGAPVRFARGGVKVEDIVFDGGAGSDVSAYLVTPPGAGPFAGVLWIHWLGEPDLLVETGG